MTDGPDLDYDHGALWLPSLHAHLAGFLPASVEQRLKEAEPEGPWSARDALGKAVDLDDLYRRTRTWIEARGVIAYHGTRLSENQVEAVAREGLRPLVMEDRTAALTAWLDSHPRWPEIEGRLPEAIAFVRRNSGSREGQVHLTLSRAGLLFRFNHYLVEGSEFDHHVANFLLGDDARNWYRHRGRAMLYRVRLTGREALAAANPHGEFQVPNLIDEVVLGLAWSMAMSDQDTAKLEIDCGMMLLEGLPSDRIIEAIEVPDEVLWPHYDMRAR
jgi:hypothetical protein